MRKNITEVKGNDDDEEKSKKVLEKPRQERVCCMSS
jgi:hypothetical protein